MNLNANSEPGWIPERFIQKTSHKLNHASEKPEYFSNSEDSGRPQTPTTTTISEWDMRSSHFESEDVARFLRGQRDGK